MTAFSSLLPSHITISRAIDISATAKDISAQITDLRKWPQWNTYVNAFPPADFFADSIKNASLSVRRIFSDDQLVKTSWQQNQKSFPAAFRLIPQQSVTTVQWYFEFTFKWYPWEKFGSIVYDKQLGPEMEQSLLNLKRLLEKAP